MRRVPGVSIAKTVSHAGVRERCRDPKTGGKLQPPHSGLAEGIGSAEMGNLGLYVSPDYSGSQLPLTPSGITWGRWKIHFKRGKSNG